MAHALEACWVYWKYWSPKPPKPIFVVELNFSPIYRSTSARYSLMRLLYISYSCVIGLSCASNKQCVKCSYIGSWYCLLDLETVFRWKTFNRNFVVMAAFLLVLSCKHYSLFHRNLLPCREWNFTFIKLQFAEDKRPYTIWWQSGIRLSLVQSNKFLLPFIILR